MTVRRRPLVITRLGNFCAYPYKFQKLGYKLAAGIKVRHVEEIKGMNLAGYHPIAVAVFAFLAFIVQIPVFLAQTIGPTPNMPIATISFWFMYLNISTFINSIEFNGPDFSTWWGGEGWCDVDTHVTDASALGIMLATLTVSCHLLYVSRVTTKRMTNQQMRNWSIFDYSVCFVIPAVAIIVHPFMTINRYAIVQSIGCRHMMVLSPPVIFFHTALPVFITALLLIVNTLTLVQFYTRGKESVYQALSFKERFSVNFFWRTTIFCGAIIFTCVPLLIYNAVQNITSAEGKIFPMPWIHGKPPGWDAKLAFTWDIMKPMQRESAISAAVLKVMIIFLSFVGFLCFGTGSSAVMFYHDPLQKFRRSKQPDSPIFTPYSATDKDGEKGGLNVHISEYTPKANGGTSW